MILVNGKTFFRGQQYLRLIKLLASVALEIRLVTYCYHQKSVFPAKNFLYSLSIMLLLNGKSFLISQKDLRLIYLCTSLAIEIWLVKYLYHQKWICGVTGDVFLLFPIKVLLYSLLICYCLMENHFSEVKKTLDSFTYDLHYH